MRFLEENEKWRATRKKESSTFLKNNAAGDTRRMDWERERDIFFLSIIFIFIITRSFLFLFFFFFRFNKTKRKIEESILSSPARRRNYCPSRDGNHLGRFDTIDILMSLIVHYFNTLFLSPFLEEKIKDKINPIGTSCLWCK